MLFKIFRALLELLIPWVTGPNPLQVARNQLAKGKAYYVALSRFVHWNGGNSGTFRLETVNSDVLWLITEHVHQRGSLRALSLVSRTLRNLVLPFLFSRCLVNVLDDPKLVRIKEFPDAFCGHLIHRGPFRTDTHVQHFQDLVGRMTCLTSITFMDVQATLLRTVIKPYLNHPCITCLSFCAGGDSLENLPLRAEDLASDGVLSLTALSWTPTRWREHGRMCHGHCAVGGQRAPLPASMGDVYALEKEFFGMLLFRMTNTATHLSLPMESAPIEKMARVSWPNLKHLSLVGRLVDANQVQHIRRLLTCLPALQSLSIQAARTQAIGRPPIFKFPGPPSKADPRSTMSQAPGDTSICREALLPHLRSLTIAYPDPGDELFAYDWSRLTHLSLRACPGVCACDRIMVPVGFRSVAAPTAQECLSILKRMEPRNLRSLELSYFTNDSPAPDKDLLSHIAATFRQLEHLEIYRHRRTWHWQENDPHHLCVAQLLAGVTSLRTVKLHLDPPQDCRSRCHCPYHSRDWRMSLRSGPEMLEVMRRRCPMLHHIQLLFHCPENRGPTWVEFHPTSGRWRKHTVVWGPAELREFAPGSELYSQAWLSHVWLG
ncbi:hypothetical protein LXA43DRAFT_316247 [Ganoderma leucocontextum]|nr:hypothetical protein LXA43DRAFT_316247 [Ganoderma leucocontextum]